MNQLIILMQSVSPQILKHFIPIQFSQSILDNKFVPSTLSPPKEANPLQNIKLKKISSMLSHQQCQLIFNNKSNQEFVPKQRVSQQTIRNLMRSEKKDLLMIKQRIQQEQNEEVWRKNSRREVRGYGAGVASRINKTAKTTRSGQISTRSTTGRGSQSEAKGEYQHRQSLTAREGSRSRHRSPSHRLSLVTGLCWFNKKNTLERQMSASVQGLKVRGSRAPQQEMVDSLRKNHSQSGRFLHPSR